MNVEYAKYNRHRAPQFQVETVIAEESGQRFVVKHALTPDAGSHVQAIYQADAILRQQLVGDRLRLPNCTRVDPQTIRYEFVDGQSLDALLFAAMRCNDVPRFLTLADGYVSLLKQSFRTVPAPVLSSVLQQVFGVKSAEELGGATPCLAVSSIDPVFENMILRDGIWYFIDNEWMFEGSLPVDFVIYRSLTHFFRFKYVDFKVDDQIACDVLLARYGITPAQAECYSSMEEQFQRYVFGGERTTAYKLRYVKNAETLQSLNNTIASQADDLRHKQAWIEHVHEVLGKEQQNSQSLNTQLHERTRELSAIYESKSWKIMRAFCSAADAVMGKKK